MASAMTALLLGAVAIFVAVGRSALTVSLPLTRSDAIVLLAGSYEERSPVVLSLYQAGYAGRILLTDDGVRRGWSREHQRNLYTNEWSELDLVRRGAARSALVSLSFQKSGTVYDALAVRDYVIKHTIHSIILVTSDYHTRRSLWIFRRVLHDLPVTIGILAAPSRARLIPDIALEYVKLAYYRLRFELMDPQKSQS